MTVGDLIYLFRVIPAIPDSLVCYCNDPDHGMITPEDWVSDRWKIALKPEYGDVQDHEAETVEDAFTLITEHVLESEDLSLNVLRKDFVDMIPGDVTITPCGLDAVGASLYELVPLMSGGKKFEFEMEEPNV